MAKYKKESKSYRFEEDLLRFGIYRGKPIGDIMRKDSDYIDWCVQNYTGFKLWKKLTTRFAEIKEENDRLQNDK